MRRGPTGAAGAACAVVALAAACAAEPNLPLPAIDGVVQWVVVASTPTNVRAEVLDPAGAIHLDTDGRLIEALAFTRALGVPLGPLSSPSDGEPLPTAAGVFAADLDHLSWSAAPISSAAAGLRLPASENDCPRYAAQTVRLSADEPAGINAMVRMDDNSRLLIAPQQWFLVTVDEVHPVPPLVTGVVAIAREPSVPTGGDFVLARGNELWGVTGDLINGTAALRRTLPPGFEPFSIAAPIPAVIYGLTSSGILFRSDTATTTVVHRFNANLAGSRGMVIVDGTGILAGLGPDGTLVAIDENGVKRTSELPSTSDGIVSIARFSELGVVVGTNNGGLLTERLDFQPVPDPLGQMPRGVPIRALHKIGDRLLFGGNSGVFGEISERRFVCTSPLPASASVRVIEPLADQILATGLPIQANSSEVYLTRYTAQP